jgi:hypothetical protein
MCSTGFLRWLFMDKHLESLVIDRQYYGRLAMFSPVLWYEYCIIQTIATLFGSTTFFNTAGDLSGNADAGPDHMATTRVLRVETRPSQWLTLRVYVL